MTVVCLSRNQHHHFAPLYDYFDIIEIADWSPGALEQYSSIDLLITPSCDWYEAHKCIHWAKSKKIPILYMMDGIIEWRHQWENPAYASGGNVAFNQVLSVDKIACLGFLSARTLEAWGNIGRCEIVGVPRFDHYLENPIPPASNDDQKRLLIMTANTPGFTPQQIKQVEDSLIDVNAYLQSQTNWKPIWRLSKSLDQKLGLTDDFPELRGKSLRDVLAQSHAVLSTPSTVLLESMLSNRPTAVLDYSNSPKYVPTAWSISAAVHIEPILTDMLQFSTNKLLFQEEILHNTLECRSPALPRMIKVIETLIKGGQTARETTAPLQFPSSILGQDTDFFLPDNFDLSKLYPNHPVFVDRNLISLQQQLIFAQQEITDLTRQLVKIQKNSIVSTILRKVLKRT